MAHYFLLSDSRQFDPESRLRGPTNMEAMLLLVEDETLISEVLEDALVDAGFVVVKAKSGKEAISALEADATRIRAIITDIKLGSGLDGWSIAHRAREMVPTMPIVYMSGDSAHEWASEGVPGSVMLAKPFASAQLVTAVSTLINDADMRGAHAPDQH